MMEADIALIRKAISIYIKTQSTTIEKSKVLPILGEQIMELEDKIERIKEFFTKAEI